MDVYCYDKAGHGYFIIINLYIDFSIVKSSVNSPVVLNNSTTIVSIRLLAFLTLT